MKNLYNDIMDVLSRYYKGIVITLVSFLIIFIVIYAGASYKVTQSSDCNSCHYMAPYVRHWENSDHAMVDCVSCHDYSAGDLLISTVKYTANAYNPRPLASVPDENCLSEGCHDMESLDEGKKFKKNIFFQHRIHLNKILRGGKLHCTSCHNQMGTDFMQDNPEHMAVNEASCFTCHFKDAGQGESITGCNSCHGIPKTEVEHAGFIFDHAPYLELNVECKNCHINIVKGDGSIPEDKCYSCHVERTREEFSEAEIHEIHVSTNNINCAKCHTKIEHGNFGMVAALEIACENCHLRQHNKPKQLYMGIGGKGAHEMPSQMFATQVTCTGCHTHITPEGDIMAEQEKKEASRQSCVKCHGEGYDLMFDNWKSGSKKIIADYTSFLNKVNAEYKTIGGTKKQRTTLKTAINHASEDFVFVKEGHIPHNIQYSVKLLNNNADEISRAMKRINSSHTVPNRGEGLQADKTCQTFCHGTAFFPEEVEYDGSDLPHLMHIEDMELSCSACHSTTEHGKTEINQNICSDCH